MRKIKAYLLGLVALVGIGLFFSYRILQTPLGLTSDEGAFGYNAVLLSKTGYDESNLHMPLFVLSLKGQDWRQPVPQYFMTLFLKLFGASVLNLRLSTVVVTLLSVALLFKLVAKIDGNKWAIVGSFIFLTTPLVLIQTHMALDNIYPIPFVILWLFGMYSFFASKNRWYLLLAGAALGVGFYTYKGMRATSSVWIALSVVYLLAELWKNRSTKQVKNVLASVAIFALGAAPFYLSISHWEKVYPGSIFDEQSFQSSSIYEFLHPYFSSFDPSFLFISGDATPWHSTGKHGMMLLASMPLFAIGVWQAVKKRNFMLFVLWAFLTTPLLFGLVNSVHRASRLMAMIPPYVLIALWGAKYLWEKKKALLYVVLALMVWNFADFTSFYWYKYPELTRQWFGDLSIYKDFESFSKISSQNELTPYVEIDIVGKNGVSGQFYEAAYFDSDVRYVTQDEGPLGPDSMLMSIRKEIPGMKKLDIPTVQYFIHVTEETN